MGKTSKRRKESHTVAKIANMTTVANLPIRLRSSLIIGMAFYVLAVFAALTRDPSILFSSQYDAFRPSAYLVYFEPIVCVAYVWTLAGALEWRPRSYKLSQEEIGLMLAISYGYTLSLVLSWFNTIHANVAVIVFEFVVSIALAGWMSLLHREKVMEHFVPWLDAWIFLKLGWQICTTSWMTESEMLIFLVVIHIGQWLRSIQQRCVHYFAISCMTIASIVLREQARIFD